MKRRRTSAAERDARARAQTGHSCPECGCNDFRKPSGPLNVPGGQRRYAVCRHCGLRVRMVERIEAE